MEINLHNFPINTELTSLNINNFNLFLSIKSISEYFHLYKNKYSKFRNFIFVGMGGSINLLKAANDLTNSKNTHFVDYLDFLKIQRLLKKINPIQTHIFIISKSGNSKETLINSCEILSFFKKNIPTLYHNHFSIISTIEGREKILSFLKEYKIDNFVDYNQDICGRFSGFSSNFLLPSLCFNFKINQYIEGAKRCLDDFLNNRKINDILINIISADYTLYSINVFISYINKINSNWLIWFQQLLAESTGKDGKGITPIFANGIQDQHSTLQLFLDGKKDKIFFFLETDFKQDSNLIDKCLFEFMNNTKKKMIDSNLPICNIKFKEMDEFTFGYLNMFVMNYVSLVCDTIKVDSFSQDVVEKLKLNVL